MEPRSLTTFGAAFTALVAVAVADTSLVSSPGASDQGVVLRASDRVVVPVFDDGLDYGKC